MITERIPMPETGKAQIIVKELNDLEKMTLEQMTIRPQKEYTMTDLKKIGLVWNRFDLQRVYSMVEAGLLHKETKRTRLDMPGVKHHVEHIYSVTDAGREFYEKNVKGTTY